MRVPIATVRPHPSPKYSLLPTLTSFVLASSNDSFCIIDSDSHDTKKAKHTSSAGSSPSGTIKKLKSKLPDPALARSVYPPPPRVQQLEVENAALKAELEKMVMKATLAERTLRQRAGQELALRESILSVRREVYSSFIFTVHMLIYVCVQAQRAMSATTAALRSPGFAGQPPSRTQTLIATPSITSPSTILTPTPTPVPAVKLPVVPSPRIAELEEEVRVLKAENEKQVSSILGSPLTSLLTEMDGRPESANGEVPRTVGEIEGICQAQAGRERC